MTNLSDLFPAGAGKQVSFVADGAISAAGKPVILKQCRDGYSGWAKRS